MSFVKINQEKNYWLIFKNNRLVLIKKNSKELLPSSSDIIAIKTSFIREFDIGSYNKIKFSCAEIKDDSLIPEFLEFISLRNALDQLDLAWYQPATKALSIINWDSHHQFCGRCAEQTIRKDLSFERECPSCHLIVYPRISPSIIVLIKKEDHLLMARSPHFPPHVYGLIAGFVEAGENLEETIHREVKEEVGIRIKNLQYFGSQAWPFPDSLMIGFMADYDSGEIVIDQKEIEDAGWYRYDQLPGRPSTDISIARKLIDYFVSEQKHIHNKN